MLSKGLVMKKIILALSIFTLFANGAEDNYVPANEEDFIKNGHKHINSHEGYMPQIITPDPLKSGIYGGLGLGVLSLSANNSPSIFSKKSGNNRMVDLAVVAGYNYNEYLALESRVNISAGYDNGVDFKSWGIFLKPKYEVYKGLDIYSLIGYGKIYADSINSNDLKANEATAQIGFGANYKLKNNFKVFADYIYLGKDDNGKYNNKPATFKSSTITTGITYDF
jgi:lipopolysaccharide assembly outer membrane protein LptD (OstA)